MPLYEYRCHDCDEKFERYVSAWGDAVVCPACESGSVDKLLSTFAFAASDGGSSSSAGAGCCGRGGCGCRH